MVLAESTANLSLTRTHGPTDIQCLILCQDFDPLCLAGAALLNFRFSGGDGAVKLIDLIWLEREQGQMGKWLREVNGLILVSLPPTAVNPRWGLFWLSDKKSELPGKWHWRDRCSCALQRHVKMAQNLLVTGPENVITLISFHTDTQNVTTVHYLPRWEFETMFSKAAK